jgi:hypothetical protein
LTALVWGGAVAGAIAAAGLLTVVLVRRRICAKRSPVPGADKGTGANGEPAGPEVEVLYFDGCPNHVPALALIERVAGELDIKPNLRLVNVADQEAAERLRFLGSPTIRIGGRDVDPYTEERTDYGLSCRLFVPRRESPANRTSAGCATRSLAKSGPAEPMLAHLFDAELVYRSDIEPLIREGEGELIGSGDGSVVGDAITGALVWTLLERPGRLSCAMNPVALIATEDGARVRLEGRGFARRSDEASRL